MAVTNGWGQAAKNNTNGFGKLATNNIGAGSIYDSSYAGDTALIGVSAAFSYSAASFTQADSNPTPTITGTTGGTFSGTSGLVFVSTSTGEINLSASTIAAHVVTYTVDGVSADFSLSVTSAAYASTRSFSFDGVDSYFEIQNSTELQLTTDISISVWFKIDSNPTNTFLNIITKWISGDAAWSVYVTKSTGVLSFWVSINGSTQLQIHSTTNVNDNNWHHFTGTNDGTNHKLYIDGVLEATGTSGNIYNSTQNILIGKTNQNSFLFEGHIDEVSIWDSALSSDAVTEIFNEQPSGSGKPNDLTSLTNASSSNLKAWYKMGE